MLNVETEHVFANVSMIYLRLSEAMHNVVSSSFTKREINDCMPIFKVSSTDRTDLEFSSDGCLNSCAVKFGVPLSSVGLEKL